jgi:cysteine desulfurase
VNRPTVAAIDCDRAATTPLHPRVLEGMLPWLGRPGANASAIHAGGRAARAALEDARERVAAAVGARAAEVIFTSGASEADQLAVQGVLARRPHGTLLLGATEHPAVVRTAQALERQGRGVTWLPPSQDGRLDPQGVAAAIRDDTAVVAAMRVNNETGVVNPVAEIAAVASGRGALLLCDAVQALGFEPLDRDALGADLLVLSAHKIGGPQGIGALVVRAGIDLEPQALGGSQERGRRAGTSPVALAVGFGLAAERAAAGWPARAAHVRAVRDRFEARLWAHPAVAPSLSAAAPRSAKHAHIVIPALRGDAETLLMQLDLEGVWASLGSACAAGSLEPSPVLLAMGWDRVRARSALRFSFGEDHTIEDADEVATRVLRAIDRTLT